jgi:methionine-rich copper-binding protein CopC
MIGAPRTCGLILAAALASPVVAAARPVQMMESTPKAETIIDGDHAQYVVRFDGPVNHLASRLEITQSGNVVTTLRPLLDSAVDVLFASGPVPVAGHYMLHWTAVSADGDGSSGEIPFSVSK